MAKLNVTYPAVDVVVNGQAYRKVDRKLAQAGDIVKVISSDYDMEYGGFYPVGDGPSVVDDVNDRVNPFGTYPEDFEVYAPLSVDPPAASSDELTFGGAQYRKVERPAREGDVIIITKVVHPRYEQRVTVGNAYLVTEVDDAGDAQIADNNGRNYDTIGDTFDVYEKVAEEVAQAPDMPPVEYREVKRWAEKGERIRIVNRHPNEHRYEQGAEFVVNSVDGDGDVRVTFGGNDRKLVVLSEYVVLEPIAQPIVAPAQEYVEVDRKAAVGERIKIVEAYAAMDNYVTGDEFAVKNVRYDGAVYVEEHDRVIAQFEYVVLEPAPAQASAQPKRYVAGDFVKVTSNSVGHEYTEGSVVKIAETKDNARHGGQQFRAEKADGTFGNWLVTDDVEPADEAAFNAQKPHPKRLTIGDFAKVIAARSGHNYEVGSVVKISVDDHRSMPYKAEKADGTTGNWLYESVLEPATEAEFLAQRKPAEPARLEVGDIVRIARARYDGDRLVIGEVRKVAEVDSSSVPYRANKMDGSDHDWFRVGDLVKLTADEVAAIEKEAQETAKWAAIGRKVGEFKRGDIVEATRLLGKKERVIGEVEDVPQQEDGGMAAGLRLPDGTFYAVDADGMALITPVEQRFDTEQAA
jgi:hypothetical protein